jgi:hypothetical protein
LELILGTNPYNESLQRILGTNPYGFGKPKIPLEIKDKKDKIKNKKILASSGSFPF